MATDVSAPLPEVDLQPLSTLTVTLSDPGATITALNVHGFQDDATDAVPIAQPGTAFAFGDTAA